MGGRPAVPPVLLLVVLIALTVLLRFPVFLFFLPLWFGWGRHAWR